MIPTPPPPDKPLGLFRPKQASGLVFRWWWNLKLWFRIRRARLLAADLHYLSFVAWHDGDDEASKEFHKAAAYVEKIEGELRQLSQRGTDAASGS